MIYDNSRSAIAHDLLNPFLHLRRVALYPAVTTKRLVLHKTAFLATFTCILNQLLTFIAKFFSILISMIFMTIKLDHL